MSWADSLMVTARLEALARSASHSGYQSTMTSNPRLVSHAIFEWWWVTKDNHGRYERLIRDASTASARAAAAAANLNMDNVGVDTAHDPAALLVRHAPLSLWLGDVVFCEETDPLLSPGPFPPRK